VNDDMTIDPQQIRGELTTLLAGLPDPDAPDADIEEIAARLEQAHEVLVEALQSVERSPTSSGIEG
jgi:hypothetical protein